MKAAIYLLLSLFVFQVQTVSQISESKTDPVKTFQFYYDQAISHINSDLYAEGIISLNKAIEIAQEADLKRKYLQANIDLAETLRKTGDMQPGVDILLKLEEHPEYPLQETRRLGRIAAIYHQHIANTPKAQWDSVTKYLNPALKLAIDQDFPMEIASLKNEYGYLVSRHRHWQEGLPYHLDAAQIYFENGDKRNYAGVMSKVLGVLIHETQDYARIDSIYKVVLDEVEGKNWFTVEIELFAGLVFYNTTLGKELEAQKAKTRHVEAILNQYTKVSTKQLDNLRVSYETERFQNEAETNAAELNRQRARNKELIIYLSVLGLLVFAIAWLFYRERKTKKVIDGINQELQVANEKYQTLMVESNHRIKNNLQMIISMLEYTGKDVNPENTRAIKRMSGKIHTISALHKHLYTDVHNARVDLATYFKEIINLYDDLAADSMEIYEHFDEVSIQSERLVYFGLILNEMLSNTLEHNQAPQKEVYIKASRQDEAFQFEYRDESAHLNEQEGTGSQLIRQLISRIGGQNMEFDPKIGQYKFLFYA